MAPFPLDAAMKKLLRSIDIAFGLALTMAVAMMVITALPSQALAAQAVAGDGRAAGEHRNVPEFNAISVSGSFDVKVRQAAVASVDVQADANLLLFLETVVEDGKTLQIRWKRSASVRARVTPVITVVVTQLQALASSGDSHVRVTALQTPQLATSIAGSGNTELEKLQTGQLQVSIAGSGDLTAAGQAGRVVVKISGSGNVHAEALKADDVTISIAGSGNAAVQAEKSLTVSIAGSGDVSYSGAATVKSSVAGSGSVRKR